MDNLSTKEKYSHLKYLIILVIKLLIITTSLINYKYIYDFRINQLLFLKIFLIFTIFLWIFNILDSGKIYYKISKLNYPILLFAFIIIISIIKSNIFCISLNDLLLFLSYFFIYFLIINIIDQKKYFNLLIKLLFITTTLISLYTIFQYYGFDPYLKEINRLSSTIGQKNWISNYLSMIFPIIFFYFLLEKSKKNKIVYFFLLSIIYITLMICQSRGIWISICLTTIFAIYIIFKFSFFKIFQENRKWLILLILIFIIITIIYSTDNLLNKSAITVPQRALSTFDEQDPSINTRLLIWGTTLDMIKDNPLLGSGIGTFKMNYLNYQANFLKNNLHLLKYSSRAEEAHNEYLQIGAELGILGLGIFILIIIIFYGLVINYFKNSNKKDDKIIIFSIVLGISCFLFHSLFTFPLHVPTLGVVFFILLGLSVVYLNKYNLKEKVIEIKILKIIKNKNYKFIFYLLLIIMMIVIIEGFVLKPYIAEMYYMRGAANIQYKNYNQALSELKYANNLEPYNGRILYSLGRAYCYLNNYELAEKSFKDSELYIPDANTLYNLGVVYCCTNMYDKAKKEFSEAIRLNPKLYQAYYRLGLLYLNDKDYDKAIVEWSKILEIDPNFSEKYSVLYYIGLTYQKKEMSDEALEYFIQALQLVPEDSTIIEEIEKEIYNIYRGHLDN